MALTIVDVATPDYIPDLDEIRGRLVDTQAMIERLRAAGGDLIADGWRLRLKGHIPDDLLMEFQRERLLIAWQCATAAASVGRACWLCSGVAVKQLASRPFCSECAALPELRTIVERKAEYERLGKLLDAMEDTPNPRREILHRNLLARYREAREALSEVWS